jgi:tRNA nucleotidyltransferase (CCA-adding enzyme)
MAADPLTGELFDPFNGLKDLRERRLKVTDPERFRDDPLRVLRGIQFMSRFGLEIDADTVPILQEMAPFLKELPKERILEEWKKLLLKSEKPSLGLAAAMTLGILREIHPELPPLKETPQEPDWHPEGDAWIHTLMVIDEAGKIVRRENLNSEQAFVILLTALCHDLGKPKVTEIRDGKIISHKHEEAGEEPTLKFLETLGVDNLTRDKVIRLVVNHLAPALFFTDETVRGNKVSDGAIRRLAKRIHPATIRELVYIAEADHLGRGFSAPFEVSEQVSLDPTKFEAGTWLMERARQIAVENSKPADLTQGRDWLGFGFKPGRELGRLIQLSNELRDEKGFTREQVFSAIGGMTKPDEAIAKLESLL